MKRIKNYFPGSFILHPISILSILLIIFNDFYLKPSKLSPLIAGKLSDISLMIFLPIFISFIFIFIKFILNSILIIIKKDLKENYFLPSSIIILSLILSGGVLTLLQVSDQFNIFFEKYIILLKELLTGKEFNKINLTKDLYDLIAIPFLLIPYFLLNKYKKSKINSQKLKK